MFVRQFIEGMDTLTSLEDLDLSDNLISTGLDKLYRCHAESDAAHVPRLLTRLTVAVLQSQAATNLVRSQQQFVIDRWH